MYKTLGSGEAEEEDAENADLYERYVLHVPLSTLHALSTPKTDFYQRVMESCRMAELGGNYEKLLEILRRLD